MASKLWRCYTLVNESERKDLNALVPKDGHQIVNLSMTLDPIHSGRNEPVQAAIYISEEAPSMEDFEKDVVECASQAMGDCRWGSIAPTCYHESHELEDHEAGGTGDVEFKLDGGNACWDTMELLRAFPKIQGSEGAVQSKTDDADVEGNGDQEDDEALEVESYDADISEEDSDEDSDEGEGAMNHRAEVGDDGMMSPPATPEPEQTDDSADDAESFHMDSDLVATSPSSQGSDIMGGIQTLADFFVADEEEIIASIESDDYGDFEAGSGDNDGDAETGFGAIHEEETLSKDISSDEMEIAGAEPGNEGVKNDDADIETGGDDGGQGVTVTETGDDDVGQADTGIGSGDAKQGDTDVKTADIATEYGIAGTRNDGITAENGEDDVETAASGDLKRKNEDTAELTRERAREGSIQPESATEAKDHGHQESAAEGSNTNDWLVATKLYLTRENFSQFLKACFNHRISPLTIHVVVKWNHNRYMERRRINHNLAERGFTWEVDSDTYSGRSRRDDYDSDYTHCSRSTIAISSDGEEEDEDEDEEMQDEDEEMQDEDIEVWVMGDEQYDEYLLLEFPL